MLKTNQNITHDADSMILSASSVKEGADMRVVKSQFTLALFMKLFFFLSVHARVRFCSQGLCK